MKSIWSQGHTLHKIEVVVIWGEKLLALNEFFLKYVPTKIIANITENISISSNTHYVYYIANCSMG